MNSLVVGLVLLGVPGCYPEQTLDKTGTSRFQTTLPAFKTLKKQEPAGAGSFLAERAGFSDRGPDARSRMQQLLRIIQPRPLTSRAMNSTCISSSVRLCHKTATTHPNGCRKQPALGAAAGAAGE